MNVIILSSIMLILFDMILKLLSYTPIRLNMFIKELTKTRENKQRCLLF